MLSSATATGLFLTNIQIVTLSEEFIETFKALPEVKFILKTGRNDVKIFAEEIDRKMIKKTIEMCNLMNVEVNSITLDMADFTSYYRIRSRLEKEKLVGRGKPE